MKRHFLIAAWLLLAAIAVPGCQPTTPAAPIAQSGPAVPPGAIAQFGRRPPAGPMPRLGLAVIRDHGNIEIKYLEVHDVHEIIMRKRVYTAVDDRGVPVQRVREITEPVVHYVTEKRLKMVAAGQYWVFQDGKLLDAAAAAKLLDHSTPVVFATFGKRKQQFDPFYLQFFKPGTVMVGFAGPGF